MGHRTDEADWEPYAFPIKFRVTRTFSLALDTIAAELHASHAVLLREAVRRGLPSVVQDIRRLRAAGYVSTTHVARELASAARVMSEGEGVVVSRWSRSAADTGVEVPLEPEVEPVD